MKRQMPAAMALIPKDELVTEVPAASLVPTDVVKVTPGATVPARTIMRASDPAMAVYDILNQWYAGDNKAA